jgi:hypothetical protein
VRALWRAPPGVPRRHSWRGPVSDVHPAVY